MITPLQENCWHPVAGKQQQAKGWEKGGVLLSGLVLRLLERAIYHIRYSLGVVVHPLPMAVARCANLFRRRPSSSWLALGSGAGFSTGIAGVRLTVLKQHRTQF